MTGTKLNHYKIVKEGLSGKQMIEEQTFASLGILTERLERLKKTSSCFSNIEFSPAAKSLTDCKKAMTV